LTPEEDQTLNEYFRVEVTYPEMFFCRLVSMYLAGGKLAPLFKRLDDFLWKFDRFHKYSYFQALAITGKR
jgi:hypothetical protein